MISPIQTVRHNLRAVEFQTAEKTEAECDFRSHIQIQHSKLEKHWYVRLAVSFDRKGDAPVNYRGKVEFEGFFDISPDFPEEKREDLVRMNGGAILYGAAREYVLGMTARSKHGPLELPTIDARMFLKKPKPKEEPVTEQK